ncbi:MAG TPA: protein-L-isoaspartate(D-aspartate) O-methyltransferase [Pyrinomonadaceae bacterium]|nr:protein-L-isoaspartate(D-aspartate) O-methyltransferase [Pyrinomonadaceae bacterium]
MPPGAMLDDMTIRREQMVAALADEFRICDPRVLAAMRQIPRHRFVPEALKAQAYRDGALPIASGQTISQPFIVARMTELLELDGTETVLEIGAGTGYQTAILATLAKKVFAIERLDSLAREASSRLAGLGFRNVTLKTADGSKGWSAYQPFDAILVAAGGPGVPAPLVAQLKVGGKLVIPVGETRENQRLIRVTRTESGTRTEDFGPCVFVPLIGDHGWKESQQ